MRPTVSIIVPAYKRQEKLHRALASIGPSCGMQHEVIVVDDCPEGSAFSVAMQHGVKYFCKGGENRGLSQSRNIGIRLARGKYLAFLDDDDFFLPNGIDALFCAIAGKTFVFGDYQELLPQQRVRTCLSDVTQNQMLVANRIPVGAYMMDRAAIRRNFDERMRSHEDWDFLLSNVDWRDATHVSAEIVAIDKTENLSTSMQARRRQHFWLDFLSIYAKFPASDLSDGRRAMLATFGVNLDESMLKQGDVI